MDILVNGVCTNTDVSLCVGGTKGKAGIQISCTLGKYNFDPSLQVMPLFI